MKTKKSWLNGAAILITGVSSGIGKELTKILIEKYSAKVFGVSRREEKLASLKNDFGNNFDYFAADVTTFENWQNILKHIKLNNIKIDILINNAGTIHNFMPFSKLDLNVIEKVMQTNYFAAVYGMKTFLPMLSKSKKSGILNISSAAAFAAFPGQSIYCASKSALTATTQSLSREVPKKFYVGTIYPGFIKTELFDAKDYRSKVFEEKEQKFIDKFSMSVQKCAEKIAKAIHHKKRRSLIGFDSKLINFSSKILPRSIAGLIKKVMKVSKLTTFKETVFSDIVVCENIDSETNTEQDISHKSL